MGFKQSLFALGELHPLRIIESRLNPYQALADVDMRGYPLHIETTRRAARALARRDQPLTVEMQLYFSCMVKKRVIFHEEGEHGAERVIDNLFIVFRTVEAQSCDPIEFAANYPERRQLTSHAALKMHPSRLSLDYRQGCWCGSFTI